MASLRRRRNQRPVNTVCELAPKSLLISKATSGISFPSLGGLEQGFGVNIRRRYLPAQAILWSE